MVLKVKMIIVNYMKVNNRIKGKHYMDNFKELMDMMLVGNEDYEDGNCHNIYFSILVITLLIYYLICSF